MNAKKTVRTILLILLAAAAIYAGDMFLGNPISRMRATRHSEAYLEGTYPGQLQLQTIEIS